MGVRWSVRRGMLCKCGATMLVALCIGILDARAHPDSSAAIRRLTDTIAAEPERASLYVERARQWRFEGRLARSRSDLARARRLAPDLAATALEAAQVELAAGRRAPARSHLRHAIALAPRWWRPRRVRAELARDDGGLDDLVEDDLHVLLSEHGSPDDFALASELFAGRDQLMVAARVLGEGGLRTGASALLTMAADVYMRAGAYGEALESLSIAEGRGADPIAVGLRSLEAALEMGAWTWGLEEADTRERQLLALLQKKSTPSRRASLSALRQLKRELRAFAALSPRDQMTRTCAPWDGGITH